MDGLPSNLPTEGDTFRRVEVITGVARRRRWTAADKARIVAESYAPGSSGTQVALRYGLHRNQLFAWRRQLRDASAVPEATGSFIPVTVAGESGVGRIALDCAGVTIRLGAGFDAGELRRVLLVVRDLP
ncbi:MAG: transposase [Gammaproteobacteria bacterium]|nr:transposase [Gammaproteobacteria bacterium]